MNAKFHKDEIQTPVQLLKMLRIKLDIKRKTQQRQNLKKEISQSNMQLERELDESVCLFTNRTDFDLLIESLRNFQKQIIKETSETSPITDAADAEI